MVNFNVGFYNAMKEKGMRFIKSFYKTLIFSLFLWINFIIPLSVNGQYSISGKVNLDSNWVPKAYLSALDRWDDYFMVFDNMVIKEAPVNANGYFQFTGLELSEKKALYRVLFIEKGRSVNSLINGTIQTNHIDFVLSQNDTIAIEPLDQIVPLGKYRLSFTSIPENHQLQKLKSEILEFEVQIASVKTTREKELQIENKNKALRHYLDTSQNVFCQFLALRSIDQSFTDIEEYYLSVFDNANSQSIDYKYIRSLGKTIAGHSYPKISKQFYQIKWGLIISIICNLILIMLVLWLWQKRSKVKKSAVAVDNLYQLLTEKEKEVLELMKKGQSNQSIANSLYIELSTVKSHINNIYRKTGFSDRQELIMALNKLS